MPASRRSLLAGACAGVASLAVTEANSGTASVSDTEVAALIRRSMDSNPALMRGDIDRYRALIPLLDSFTLMSPFGGKPTRGADMTEKRRGQAMGRFFEQELVQSYGSADMVVLAIIERAHVEVGDLPAQECHPGLSARRERLEACASTRRSARGGRQP